MDHEEIHELCTSLPGATWDHPFGPDTRVYRVAGKIFALIGTAEPARVNLKCDPDLAPSLREDHPEHILPGYHMNKRHWNTVVIGDGALGDVFVTELVEDSYDLIVASLPASKRPAG